MKGRSDKLKKMKGIHRLKEICRQNNYFSFRINSKKENFLMPNSVRFKEANEMIWERRGKLRRMNWVIGSERVVLYLGR